MSTVHESHPRTGIVSTFPIHTESMPKGALFSHVTCGCPAHIAWCKGEATKMGLTGVYYPDPDRAGDPS